MPNKKMRAIDLYSGIGGWSIGLRCAGIEVVEAFEIWPKAVETYNKNLNTNHRPIDIRNLDLRRLPKNIDLVVGSPPCTEFSYANRGGGGDVNEGLKDIVKFFEIVEHLKPKYWLMENVPRTADVIESGLNTKGHPLYRFRHLKPSIEIFNFAELGLPQSRVRCVVGVFPVEILENYKNYAQKRTLKMVISALKTKDKAIDPNWGFKISKKNLTETEIEDPIDSEQLRMNWEAKKFHPVYNDMDFPDRLDSPSRTVTATCTRVSRESIIIADPNKTLRRLTIRERATLQSFPITFQFYAETYNSKMKMIGNALPPLFAYLAGMAVQKYSPARAFTMPNVSKLIPKPKELAPIAPPRQGRVLYPLKRRFRSAVPNLRFKTGMRFELTNEFKKSRVFWSISFYYGPSKNIQTIDLDDKLFRRLRRHSMAQDAFLENLLKLEKIESVVTSASAQGLQSVWTKRDKGKDPYDITDMLGQAAKALTKSIKKNSNPDVYKIVLMLFGLKLKEIQLDSKFIRYAPEILAGLIVGSWFNSLEWEVATKRAA